jgi:hypothetical protein
MPSSYRALTEEFIRHMDQRGWPAIKKVESWFQREANGIKRERYTQLKRGDALAEKYAVGFIRLLLAERNSADAAHYRALQEYLSAKGIPHPAMRPLDEVVAGVCDPPNSRPTPRSLVADLLQRGMDALAEVIQTKRLLQRHIRQCETEDEVREAIEWFYVGLGQVVASEGTSPNRAEAIRLASEYTRTSLADYQNRAVQWWRINPWIVTLAQGNRRPAAMTIVIPVTPDGYLGVLAGDYMTYDVPLKQIHVPSAHLLLEAVMERPRELGAESIPIKSLTRAMYAANIAQAGVFSHRLSASKTDAIRILSFGGSPVNEKRLKAFGFRSTGRCMPQTRLEYLEKRMTLAGPLSQDTLYLSLMRHFGELLDPVEQD